MRVEETRAEEARTNGGEECRTKVEDERRREGCENSSADGACIEVRGTQRRLLSIILRNVAAEVDGGAWCRGESSKGVRGGGILAMMEEDDDEEEYEDEKEELERWDARSGGGRRRSSR
jgi:hypothetical protein